MLIHDIEQRLEQAKLQALEAMGVDAATAAQIHMADPPDPAMGERGFPCFVLSRQLKRAPAQIAQDLAQAIAQNLAPEDIIAAVTPAGPYVNFRLHPGRVARIVVEQALGSGTQFGAHGIEAPEHWMVEYSAPNTNKPQHLGHVRNNLLGAAVARILAFAGHRVTRVNLINDRGIHICKSMLAYELFSEGETPQSSGEKGDHFVGRYYVLFEKRFQQEYHAWQNTDAAHGRLAQWLESPKARQAAKDLGSQEPEALAKYFFSEYKDTYFNQESELGAQAKHMLRQWEAGDEKTLTLWQTMNSWVLRGFDQTYARLGVGFDRVYYESDTYKLGKEVVAEGLAQGKLTQAQGGPVVCDLAQVGLSGQKVLLRSDGTSVYMTQDLGTAVSRFEEYDMDRMVYVVGNEQDFHFDVLFRVLGLLYPRLAGRMYHLSYGMVLLPEGKMKSREGKVVDADDLMEAMIELARQAVAERYEGLAPEDMEQRAHAIGLAALKYYILDFTPRSTVQFDPARSIDFQGRTGPYCLYSYARIQSIGRKLGGWPDVSAEERVAALLALGTELERSVVRQIQDWPRMVALAAQQHDPSKITEALFHLGKAFSTLYNDDAHRIIDLDGPRRQGLLLLAQAVATTLKAGLGLLGIDTIDEM